MARNGSGTYSKVNTFVAGNTITAAGHNDNWDDLVTEMTNSVAADGQTTMTGALKLSNGTVTAPALTFGSDTNHGIYRIGADNMGFTLAGSKVGDWSTTGLSITGTLTSSGALTVSGGGAAITGALTVSTTADVTGNFNVNTSKFSVVAASGNTTVAGTLGVTSDLAVNTNKFTVTAASGNTVVAGTLGVTGNATFSGDVSAATISGAVIASQADQETATSTTKFVTPGRQHFHPGMAKAWAKFAANGTIALGYNVSGVVQNSTGNWTITFTTAFSTADYVVVATPIVAATDTRILLVKTQAAGSFTLRCVASDAGSTQNPDSIYFVCYGDFA